MTYFFIPGRLSKLSFAEFYSQAKVFWPNGFTVKYKCEQFLLADLPSNPEFVTDFFNRLGGFLRFGEILSDSSGLLQDVKTETHISFGVSVFNEDNGRQKFKKAQEIAFDLKQALARNNVSSRFVLGENEVLTTGQVVQHKLLEEGLEIVVLNCKDGTSFYGVTKVVQDIEGFAKRDFEKPGIDKEMGMLPPKLARIMVNLAALPSGSTVWDPFCGSGVILLEGALLGHNMLGSDRDRNAIANSEKNMQWLSQNFKLADVNYRVFQQDIMKMGRSITKQLKRTDINAIVTEPYMGPPQYKILNLNKAEKLVNEVGILYSSLFRSLETMVKPGLVAVIVVPSYKTSRGWLTLNLRSFLSKKWDILKNDYLQDLHWERSNSIIMRNIFVLKFKS